MVDQKSQSHKSIDNQRIEIDRDALKHLSLKLQIYWETQPVIERHTAERFNIFDYVPSSEVSLSRILADLFRTDGTHGQGDLFLRLFLRLFAKIEKRNLTSKIWTEYHIQSGRSWRRLDIFGNFKAKEDGQIHFALENKPYASEGLNQVANYTKWLSKKYSDNFVFFYLGRSDDLPISIEENEWANLSAEGKAHLITYNDLINWIEQCMIQVKAEKMRWFLSELKDFINNNFAYETDDE